MSAGQRRPHSRGHPPHHRSVHIVILPSVRTLYCTRSPAGRVKTSRTGSEKKHASNYSRTEKTAHQKQQTANDLTDSHCFHELFVIASYKQRYTPTRNNKYFLSVINSAVWQSQRSDQANRLASPVRPCSLLPSTPTVAIYNSALGLILILRCLGLDCAVFHVPANTE